MDSDNKDKFGRELYEIDCSECKKKATVPFEPSPDRPVYCFDCFKQQKNNWPTQSETSTTP